MTLTELALEASAEDPRSELRRYVLTAAVLVLNVGMALVPAVIGALALFGALR